jgi:hypothetical protein
VAEHPHIVFRELSVMVIDRPLASDALNGAAQNIPGEIAA